MKIVFIQKTNQYLIYIFTLNNDIFTKLKINSSILILKCKYINIISLWQTTQKLANVNLR